MLYLYCNMGVGGFKIDIVELYGENYEFEV